MLQKLEKHCREHREPGVLCPEMKMHQSKQIKQKKRMSYKKSLKIKKHILLDIFMDYQTNKNP